MCLVTSLQIRLGPAPWPHGSWITVEDSSHLYFQGKGAVTYATGPSLAWDFPLPLAFKNSLMGTARFIFSISRLCKVQILVLFILFGIQLIIGDSSWGHVYGLKRKLYIRKRWPKNPAYLLGLGTLWSLLVPYGVHWTWSHKSHLIFDYGMFLWMPKFMIGRSENTHFKVLVHR